MRPFLLRERGGGGSLSPFIYRAEVGNRHHLDFLPSSTLRRHGFRWEPSPQIAIGRQIFNQMYRFAGWVFLFVLFCLDYNSQNALGNDVALGIAGVVVPSRLRFLWMFC